MFLQQEYEVNVMVENKEIFDWEAALESVDFAQHNYGAYR